MIKYLLDYPEIVEEFEQICKKRTHRVIYYRVFCLFDLKKVFKLIKPPSKNIDWETAIVLDSASKGYTTLFREQLGDYKSGLLTLIKAVFEGGSIEIYEILKKNRSISKLCLVCAGTLVKFKRYDLLFHLIEKGVPFDKIEIAQHACVYDDLFLFKEFYNFEFTCITLRMYGKIAAQNDSFKIYKLLEGQVNLKRDGWIWINAVAYSKPDKCQIAKDIANSYPERILDLAVGYNKTYLIDYVQKTFLIGLHNEIGIAIKHDNLQYYKNIDELYNIPLEKWRHKMRGNILNYVNLKNNG